MKQYMRFCTMDLKRAVSGKGFWLAMLLLLAVFMNSFYMYVRTDGSMSTYEIIVDAMALSGFGPFAAVFPALGYASRFCQEYNSGYLKLITSRMSCKWYGRIRILTVGVSGGLIMGIPCALYFGLSYIIGKHGVPENGMAEGVIAGYYLQQYGDWYVIVFKLLLSFLFGIMFSLISLAFAVWSANRYVAMIAPFILYETMWALIPLKLKFLNPIYMVRGDDLGSYPLSAWMELLYIGATVMIVWLGMKRRMERT